MSEDVENGAVSRPLEAVCCLEDLARLLNEEIARADLSLRDLQNRTARMGMRLARSTCSDMLAGRRFPKKAQMVAFLMACGVPEHQIPEWERAWERVRMGRMPALAELERRTTPGDGSESAETAARPGEGRPTWFPDPRLPGRGRHRVIVLAVLTAVAAVGAAVIMRGDATITDDGRAFGEGGSSRFTVTVNPANTGVRLIRRLDANIGRQRATVTVNGVPAGEWEPLPASSYGWADQSIEIPAAITAGRRTLAIVNTYVSSTVDFNEFRYTVRQRIDGQWSTADIVDVGPENTASEAAHHYQITGATFTGRRTYVYPPGAESREDA
ncbi:hypothetical protein AB0K60_29710 [Thermopolyspora sp. NPDC052614]|uniref:hypothetical protein n=1 Tax=Thermopolyspora sp. NPDC052614 TaxID=3155682 RepID=UPI003440BA73